MAAYAESSLNPGQSAIATRSATQPVAASLLPGSSARCATSATAPARPRRRRSADPRRPGAAPPDAQPVPQLVQHPRPRRSGASPAPRSRRRARPRSPAAGPRTARSRTPAGPARRGPRLGAAEVVDHLRLRHPGDRVALAVRQLQVTDHAAGTVAPLRLPQVHTYTISTYQLLISADTPEIVCLHVFAVRAASRASYQRWLRAPRNMPTNFGSRDRGIWVTSSACHSGNGPGIDEGSRGRHFQQRRWPAPPR